MADALRLLVPPIGPQAPAETLTPSLAQALAGGAGLWLAGVLCVVLALAILAPLWWRRRWQRALQAVRRQHSPAGAAELLACAARQRQIAAPPAWWQALDAVRFGRRSPEHAASMTRLLAQAQSFAPQDRLWAWGGA